MCFKLLSRLDLQKLRSLPDRNAGIARLLNLIQTWHLATAALRMVGRDAFLEFPAFVLDAVNLRIDEG
jgi:hypothetical protein